jgi:hypothetical protein
MDDSEETDSSEPMQILGSTTVTVGETFIGNVLIFLYHRQRCACFAERTSGNCWTPCVVPEPFASDGEALHQLREHVATAHQAVFICHSVTSLPQQSRNDRPNSTVH